MKVNNKSYHTIWLNQEDPSIVQTIDQRLLPFEFSVINLKSFGDARTAIANMVVRGAPLIGVTAAYGMYLAVLNHPSHENISQYLNNCASVLKSARPTAINLSYAVDKSLTAMLSKSNAPEMIKIALAVAKDMASEEVESCMLIGEYGLPFIQDLSQKKKDTTVNILTHCNAGWLACIDYGTATAPIYMAHDMGINVHVWIDETRPRNQGARLTAWELDQHGVPHTLITDNAGGLLMQQDKVDLVIVGSDRTTLSGDVVNKIGTYQKALAAYDNNVPFYVAVPSSSIDPALDGDSANIPIEERSDTEVMFIEGMTDDGLQSVRICPDDTEILNPGFDITPARLVTGLITERGICKATREDVLRLFPEFSESYSEPLIGGEGPETS